jgi:DHA3 family macrolide efflux protein-like MFS transporter
MKTVTIAKTITNQNSKEKHGKSNNIL